MIKKSRLILTVASRDPLTTFSPSKHMHWTGEVWPMSVSVQRPVSEFQTLSVLSVLPEIIKFPCIWADQMPPVWPRSVLIAFPVAMDQTFNVLSSDPETTLNDHKFKGKLVKSRHDSHSEVVPWSSGESSQTELWRGKKWNRGVDENLPIPRKLKTSNHLVVVAFEALSIPDPALPPIHFNIVMMEERGFPLPMNPIEHGLPMRNPCLLAFFSPQ